MRPLELRVRNFRSFAGEHTFDFRDRTLVGIVGPIGSGKSTILDAISFALYARTPRIGRDIKSLINQRAADGSVSLRFVVEGEVWEAARSIRVKGQSKHALYRYDGDDPDTEPSEKLLMEGEVNERIVELLGLDFSAFERSILLAQGRFAEFLQARPAERDKVLKGVFGHDRIDRMKLIAKERRDAAAVDLERLGARLEAFDAVRARLAERKLALGEERKRKEALEKAAGQVATLDTEIEKVAAGLEQSVKRLAELDEHVSRLPDAVTTQRVLDEAVAAGERRNALAKALDEAQARLALAERKVADAVAAGEQEKLQRASEFLAAADPQLKAVVDADRRIKSSAGRLEATRSELGAAGERLSVAEQERDQALGRSAEAAKILELAEEALAKGRHADMATTLRAGLVPGDECPVCDQPVHSIPEMGDEAHVAELEEIVATARATKADIDGAYTAAIGALERAREQMQSSREKKAAAEAQLDGANKDAVRVRGDLEETTLRLEKLLGPGDPTEHLERRREQYESVVREREDAQRDVDKTRGTHDQAIRDEQEAAKGLRELGVRLTELATRLGVDLDIGDEPGSLATALQRLRDLWQSATSELRSDREAAEKALEQSRRKREGLLANVGVDGEISAAVAVTTDRIHRLAAEIDSGEQELAGVEKLSEEREGLADKVELFGRINSDLTDARFVRFLLDDERSRLAELGSEHFQRLSAGRYRFADDRFGIVDLAAADVTRRADSLSGGETFLASLGLAIALAEMVAGTGGRLDSFLLDEGFGTLDPEHLDLAMEGIERLVADNPDRLVVIVSHVPELRLRIGDLVELERNPVTGDTRVVSA